MRIAVYKIIPSLMFYFTLIAVYMNGDKVKAILLSDRIDIVWLVIC